MSSITRVTLALCLMLVLCSANPVPKTTDKPKGDKVEIALPPEGLTMDLLVRNRSTHQPVAKVKIDINEKNKKVVMSLIPDPPPDVVSVDDRSAIVVGSCPKGYTQIGDLCFKDDEDY